MLTPRGRNLPVIFLPFVLLLAGCFAAKVPISLDAEATFTAHRERGGLAIDRARAAEPVVLEAQSWFRTRGGPTFVLRVGKDRVAELSLVGSGRALVRRPTEPATTSQVDGAWDDGAIRLTFVPAGVPPFHTDVFAREGVGAPAALSRTAETILDVRGTYRASVRDSQGAPVGWFRVRVGPYQPAPRIYDARLPAEIDDGLAAAAALLLDTEISWIEDHALDVYRGTGGDRLERSLPR